MTNPKEPVKKEEPKAGGEAESPSAEVQEQVVEAPPAGEGARPVEPLVGVLGRAEQAYAAYMEAQKEVARAY